MHLRTEPLRGRPRAAWTVDVLLTLVVLLFSSTYLLARHDRVPLWLSVVVVAALAVPLVVRRVAPLVAFGVPFAVACVAGWWMPLAVWSLSFLVALYSVAVRCSRRVALACTAALAGACVVWSVRAYGGGWRVPAVALVALVVATSALGLYVAARAALLRELTERAHRAEQDRDRQVELAAAAERARIAREMHDIVAHHLTVMVALADGAAAQAGRDAGRARDAMRTVGDTGRQALTDTRRLLGVLRDAAGSGDARSPLPGLADLDGLVAGVRAAGLPVAVSRTDPPTDAGPATGLAVYRLVQEALTNTLKHAGPGAHATVTLRPDAGALVVEVADDGGARATGPARAAAGGTGGGGLTGMRERLAAVGGSLTAGPRPGGGWLVRADLPLTPDVGVPPPATVGAGS